MTEQENEIPLASIRLLPKFQNRGIGTKIILDLIEKSNKPVKLKVLKVNPARKLYERLGFKVSGETETHFGWKKDKRGNQTISSFRNKFYFACVIARAGKISGFSPGRIETGEFHTEKLLLEVVIPKR